MMAELPSNVLLAEEFLEYFAARLRRIALFKELGHAWNQRSLEGSSMISHGSFCSWLFEPCNHFRVFDLQPSSWEQGLGLIHNRCIDHHRLCSLGCSLAQRPRGSHQWEPRQDGFSIGSNDLTQLTLGLDRDSGDDVTKRGGDALT